jgi:hypothetical protein
MEDEALRLVSGWLRGFAWFILALTIVTGLQSAFLLVLGRTAVAALTGQQVRDPEVSFGSWSRERPWCLPPAALA